MFASFVHRSLQPSLLLLALGVGACTAKLGGTGTANEDGASVGSSGASGGGPNGTGGRADGSGGGAGAERASYSRTGLAARLSKFEYQNSILDVLGVTLLPEELDSSAGGIPDDTGDGVFKHLADNQTSVEQHALAYSRVAEAVANRVNLPALLTRLKVCQNMSEACGAETIQALGSRLYRRPLDQRELNAMLAVYEAAKNEQLDHEAATRWTLMALLQAPPFLFRMEDETSGVVGEPRSLSGYELGARLAAFLWVSVPDEQLLAAAADQSLLKSEVLTQELTRMLADPKARRFTEVFAIDFSRARYSSFEGSTDQDRQALNDSIVATFQDHFWTQQGGIADLFLTTRFVVNPTVSALLGLPPEGEGLRVVNVATLPHRIGLMSHPAMIAGMGDRDVGSFVNRGKYLMERLLCEHPIAFPGDLATAIDEFNAETTGLNERERAEVRMTRGPCWGCHEQFEPLAFGFARFDGAGRYVGETDSDGKALPLDGWVPTREAMEPRYEDVASYMQILATNPVVQTCMTEHFLNFATSRYGDDVARAEAERVGQAYLAGSSTLAAMVTAVAQSELFRTIAPSSKGGSP